MFAVFVLALALFQGSLGSECDKKIAECVSDVDEEGFHNLRGLPDADDLRRLCPGSKSALRCFKNIYDECIVGRPEVDQFKEQDLDNILDILEHVCDEDSRVHKIYVKNAGCLSKTIETDGPKCERGTKKLYRDFREYKTQIMGEVDPEVAQREANCFITYTVSSCLATKAGDNCGEDAFSIVHEFFNKLGVTARHCNGLDYLEASVQGFSESIPNFEEYLQELYSKKK